ncbi:agmatine deiminase family protein, partial [Streptomyces sp. NPDC059835]|uniref:agmatine deiminase family protein n=1 Tax=Streptomyces sp. NPDC059835 TaxID=3346967 RepID=UPI00365C2C4F
ATVSAWGDDTSDAFGSDLSNSRAVARQDLMRVAANLSRFEPVCMLVDSEADRAGAAANLEAVLAQTSAKDRVHTEIYGSGRIHIGKNRPVSALPPIKTHPITFVTQHINDLWTRDSAPVFVTGPVGLDQGPGEYEERRHRPAHRRRPGRRQDRQQIPPHTARYDLADHGKRRPGGQRAGPGDRLREQHRQRAVRRRQGPLPRLTHRPPHHPRTPRPRPGEGLRVVRPAQQPLHHRARFILTSAAGYVGYYDANGCVITAQCGHVERDRQAYDTATTHLTSGPGRRTPAPMNGVRLSP